MYESEEYFDYQSKLNRFKGVMEIDNKINPKRWKLYESCLIKSIRRCLVDDSVYWASVLCRLGKVDNIWRRLFIHLSEDIGLANENMPANIRALYENYKVLSNTDNKAAYETEGSFYYPVIHAVALMANSKKSKAIDSIINKYINSPQEEREVPDYAIDHHSPLGKRMGRDKKFFEEEAGKIENETEDFTNKWKL